MSLRCLLFASDEGTAQPVRQILADLGIEVEHCPAAVQAVERVTSQVFQLVIVDWDDQPEAAFLLNTARERKAAERPLTLAIVDGDATVPQALQAGANSILRKPIQISQTKDTLTTALGFLRAKQAATMPAAQAAAASASGSSAGVATGETALRAGEFLQSGETPSTHFVTESEVPPSLDEVATTEIDPLKDLEPVAGSVEEEAVPEPPPPEPEKPRGLSWYMKARAAPVASAAPAPAKTELLSFSDTVSSREASHSVAETSATPEGPASGKTSEHEQRTEAVLFAYISGESPEKKEPRQRRQLGKFWLVGGVAAVFVLAYVMIPQAVWRPKVQSALGRAARAGHNWLNPQPATTPQAPPLHENFGRAGDEYKLPVAENIPDATTDPSQIRVVPMIDPTAKQPNGANAAGQNAAPVNTAPKDNPDPTPADPFQVPQNQDPAAQPSLPVQTGAAQTVQDQPANANVPAPAQSVPTQAHTDAPVLSVSAPLPPVVQPAAPRNPQPRSTVATTSPSIPSSLKSQMAAMTPEASGNKPVEAALPSIEPVDLPEATARGLLLQRADPAYPASAKGQQGTVVLQLLIGRDGSVQDTKFQQGSLAFARAATDAVRQWRFKPYTLNTHPASVRTVITLNFKPAS